MAEVLSSWCSISPYVVLMRVSIWGRWNEASVEHILCKKNKPSLLFSVECGKFWNLTPFSRLRVTPGWHSPLCIFERFELDSVTEAQNARVRVSGPTLSTPGLYVIYNLMRQVLIFTLELCCSLNWFAYDCCCMPSSTIFIC